MKKEKNLLSRDNLRKLDPTVFYNAAVEIQNGGEHYTCHAINHEAMDAEYVVGVNWGTSRDRSDLYRKTFAAAFGPSKAQLDRYYNSGATVVPGHPFWNADKPRKKERVTALLMMAAMVESAKASRGKKKSKKDRINDRIAETLPKKASPASQWPFPLQSQ